MANNPYITLGQVKNCLRTSYQGEDDAYLNNLIISCSAFLDRYTNRLPGYFLTSTVDELVHGTGSNIMYTNYKPIQSISRVAWTSTPALSVKNNDTDMGARATAQVTSTGITLVYVKNAATTTQSFTFVTYPTITQMVAAINGAGNNWTAQVTGGFGGWPSADLYVLNNIQGAFGARVTNAYFYIYWYEMQNYKTNNLSGELTSPQVFTRGQYNWRLTYVTGYTTFPTDLAQALAEMVVACYLNKETNPNMVSENIDGYSYTRLMDIGFKGLSEASRLTIGQYRIRKITKFSSW